MTIEKGIAVKSVDYGNNTIETTTVEIVRKTKGSYIEILSCKQYSVVDNGNQTITENENDFTVYVGKTVEQVLALNGVSGNYSWSTPLTEVV